MIYYNINSIGSGVHPSIASNRKWFYFSFMPFGNYV